MWLRDPRPSCDVSCISTNIQDGEKFDMSNQNIAQNKTDVKIL